MKILILLTFITTNRWISLNDETMAITDNQSMGIITDQPILFYDKYKKIIWVVVGVSSAILGIWGLTKLMGGKQTQKPNDSKSIKELKQDLLDLFKKFQPNDDDDNTINLIRRQLKYDDMDKEDLDYVLKEDKTLYIFLNKYYQSLFIDRISKGQSIWEVNESNELKISYNKHFTDLKKINLDYSDDPLNIPLHQENYKRLKIFIKEILKEVENFKFYKDKKLNHIMTYTSKNIEVNKKILNALIKFTKILIEMTNKELENNKKLEKK
jgi:hypothetical protein